MNKGSNADPQKRKIEITRPWGYDISIFFDLVPTMLKNIICKIKKITWYQK